MKEELLYKNFTSKVTLSTDEFHLIASKFQSRILKKKKEILKYGEIANHLIFIKKGALRSYEIDQKGNQNVVQIALEEHWISDLFSFHSRTPSLITIEAIENSEILLLSHNDLEQLYLDVYIIERFFRKLFEKAYIVAQIRINDSLHISAEERYKNILKSHPNIIQRIPLIYIASYMGITPESLSRIRKNIQ